MKTFVCQDGVVIEGATDDEFVGRIEVHLRNSHPELAGRLSRNEILAMAGETGDGAERNAGSQLRF